MGRRRGARPCRLRPDGLWMERGTYLLSCRLTHLVSWPFAAVGSGLEFPPVAGHFHKERV